MRGYVPDVSGGEAGFCLMVRNTPALAGRHRAKPANRPEGTKQQGEAAQAEGRSKGTAKLGHMPLDCGSRGLQSDVNRTVTQRIANPLTSRRQA